MYTLPVKTAQWLNYAKRNKYSKGGLATFCVDVSDNRFGHVAATTDGHRLHVIEVDKMIPCGLYDLHDHTLCPADLPKHERFPDYLAITPTKFIGEVDSYDPTVLTPEKPEVKFTFLYENLLVFTQVRVDYWMIRQATMLGVRSVFKLQKPTQPILIDCLDRKGKVLGFAVVMPLHPDR